jgi:NAD(P)-dependent dehydrogenase (short-subunit alcohol dehydrogenase family)
MDLTGKVAVITGASRGLGAGMARVAQEMGMSLALCSRGAPALTPSDRVLCERLDVTDPSAMQAFATAAFARFEHVDLWVNNAGLLEPVGPLRDAPPEEFARLIEVNVVGVALGSRAYARMLHEHGGHGVLLNVSSGAARKPYFGWSGYCASKAAVDRMSEVIALEEAERLRVHAVAPGVVESEMQETLRAKDEATFRDVQRFRKLHEDQALQSPEGAGEKLLRLAFDPEARREEVCVDVRK